VNKMNIWPDWLKVIQLKPRFLFGLWLFGSLILFLPSKYSDGLGITAIREHYKGWIGTATLGALAFWVVQLIPYIKEYRINRRRRASILKSIDTLSKDEQFLLAYCIYKNQRTIWLNISHSAGNSLCQKGILERATHGAISAYPHTIPPFVWQHIISNRAMILPEEKWHSPELKQQFSEYDRRMQQNKMDLL